MWGHPRIYVHAEVLLRKLAWSAQHGEPALGSGPWYLQGPAGGERYPEVWIALTELERFLGGEICFKPLHLFGFTQRIPDAVY